MSALRIGVKALHITSLLKLKEFSVCKCVSLTFGGVFKIIGVSLYGLHKINMQLFCCLYDVFDFIMILCYFPASCLPHADTKTFLSSLGFKPRNMNL